MAEQKVIIVTGGNSGIGLATARALCYLGHEVIVSVRSDVKGQQTVEEIQSGFSKAKVRYILMDLEYPDSIRDFVAKFLALEKPLHVLINNAGLCKQYRGNGRSSARGYYSLEMTMTVNCMGTFLLTNLLLNKMKASGTAAEPARIVNVSSVVTVDPSRWSRSWFYDDSFDIDNLMLTGDGYISGAQAIRNSKIALNLWSNVLAQRLNCEGKEVIVNTVCPGLTPSTGLARESSETWTGWMGLKFLDSSVGRYFYNTKSVSVGQGRLVQMAVTDHTKTNGCFYCNNRRTAEAAEVRSQYNQDKIWDLCVRYSGL